MIRTQSAAYRLGAVTGWSTAPARLAGDCLLPQTGGLELVSRRMMLLGAGYNPREERYLC